MLAVALAFAAAPGQASAGGLFKARTQAKPVSTLKAKIGAKQKVSMRVAPRTGGRLGKVLGAKRDKSAAVVKPTAKQRQSNKAVRKLLSRRAKVRNFRKAFAGNRDKALADQAADAHIRSVMSHSESSGEYFVVSDLHWGYGRSRSDGAWDPQEDFRRGDSFAKFVNKISSMPKNVSLVVAGDWLELMEHSQADTSISEVKKSVTRIVEGHAHEVKALGTAINSRGMRLIYNGGNHDVHLTNPEVRQHLIKEMTRVAGLTGADAVRFASRVGFSGHGAVLGKYGEAMVLHGHAQDPSNNWRSVVNPYGAQRNLQKNTGWQIVTNLYNGLEKSSPLIDNANGATRTVATKILTSPRHLVTAVSVLWKVLSKQQYVGRAGALSQKLDDRSAMKAWVQRTGFGQKMETPIPGATGAKKSGSQWSRVLENIYAKMPKPIHERMTTPLRTVNFFAALVSLPRMAKTFAKAEPALLGDMTARLPNVRYIVWGHNHKEAAAVGNSAKGELGHYNTGSWTKVHGEWRLNVVHGSTDANGRLKMHGVFRTDPSTGEPNLPHEASTHTEKPIPGWGN